MITRCGNIGLNILHRDTADGIRRDRRQDIAELRIQSTERSTHGDRARQIIAVGSTRNAVEGQNAEVAGDGNVTKMDLADFVRAIVNGRSGVFYITNIFCQAGEVASDVDIVDESAIDANPAEVGAGTIGEGGAGFRASVGVANGADFDDACRPRLRVHDLPARADDAGGGVALRLNEDVQRRVGIAVNDDGLDIGVVERAAVQRNVERGGQVAFDRAGFVDCNGDLVADRIKENDFLFAEARADAAEQHTGFESFNLQDLLNRTILALLQTEVFVLLAGANVLCSFHFSLLLCIQFPA